jgi:predicted TIM-barrel fold metal-dependent hydrolase
MNVAVREPSTQTAERLMVVDCDIHPNPRTPADVRQFLPKRWQQHLATFGGLSREMYSDTIGYPRMSPAISRRDSWPPAGGPPGSDLDFMREQHLDPNGVEIGNLIPLATRGPDQRNLDCAAALCTALNEWQIAYWLEKEPRLRGSILVAYEDPPAAVAEIERRAGDKRFVQVLLPPRTGEPLGRRRYRPIFAAAAAARLPVALHVGGQGGHCVTSTGWPSYYFEEHHSNVQSMQSLLTSLVVEGVFEDVPELQVVLVEGGFAWVPPLCWRLDAQWRRFREEVPHLKLLPSEYVRRNVWFTTQPIDEPERPGDLADVVSWIGVDRLMFSTDYPHWDFDHPAQVFGGVLGAREKALVFRDNAKALFGY